MINQLRVIVLFLLIIIENNDIITNHYFDIKRYSKTHGASHHRILSKCSGIASVVCISPTDIYNIDV